MSAQRDALNRGKVGRRSRAYPPKYSWDAQRALERDLSEDEEVIQHGPERRLQGLWAIGSFYYTVILKESAV